MMLGDEYSLASVAAERPETTAVENVETGRTMTYQELAAAVDRVASGLADRGVGSGDRVVLAIGAGVPFTVSFHATVRLGAVVAPVDPAVAGERRLVRLQHIAPDLVIGASEGIDPDAGAWDHVRYEALTGPGADDVPESRRSADAVACLVSTSGTTGQPRLVALTRRNLVTSAMASAFRLGISPADRWLVPLAPHHMGGLAPIVRSAIYGTTYLCQEFEAEAVARAIGEMDVTGMSVVPIMLRRLLEADAPLDDLRFLLVGGDRTPPELVTRCLDRGGPLFVTYGMTETASQIATATPEELRSNPRTVGRPLRWLTVAIDEPNSDGIGELVVDGPMVADGYWREPAATANRFRPSGFHTGDNGRLDADGRLFVRGRRDERIVSGGVTIDPNRVRRVLENQAGVRAAVVVGIPDDEWGQRVCALIAGDDPDAIDLDDAQLRRELGDAAMPREIATTDALPRTVSGTVDRSAVRERFEGP